MSKTTTCLCLIIGFLAPNCIFNRGDNKWQNARNQRVYKSSQDQIIEASNSGWVSKNKGIPRDHSQSTIIPSHEYYNYKLIFSSVVLRLFYTQRAWWNEASVLMIISLCVSLVVPVSLLHRHLFLACTEESFTSKENHNTYMNLSPIDPPMPIGILTSCIYLLKTFRDIPC